MAFILLHRNAAFKYRQYVNRFTAATVHYLSYWPSRTELLRERFNLDNPNKIYNSKLYFTIVKYN